MKKQVSAIIIILIIMLMLWSVAGWYFGSKTEQAFLGLLEESSELEGKRIIRTELVSYRKTPSGAKANLEISSDYPLLNERLEGLNLNVNLLNGPIFLTNSGISIGSSRWLLNIVEGESDSEIVKAFKEIFPNRFPSAVVRVDFEDKAHYVADVKTYFAESFITGVFNLDSQQNRGAIDVKDFVLGDSENGVNAKNLQISYQHEKSLTTRYKPGTASVKVHGLNIQHHQLRQPLVLDVKANSNISLDENTLGGFITADIHNANSANLNDEFPVGNADISLLFKGLPADAFIAFSEANDELANLHQQAQWALEELGEVPEGQDQIWTLYDRIEETSDSLPQIIADQINEANKPLVQIKAKTTYKNKSSNLNGNLNLDTEHPNISSWLSLLKGEAQVELDENLFKSIQKMLPITDQQFKLLLKDNKVLMTK